MTNAAVFDQEMAVNNGIAAMEELMVDKAVMAAETMDEAYEAIAGHMAMAKADFLRMVAIMNPVIQSVDAGEADNAQRELSLEELEFVAGGSWFGKAWDKVRSVASSIKKKAIDTWNSMPTWAKGVAIGVAAVAVVAAGVGIGCAVYSAATAASAAASAAAAHAAAVQTFIYGAVAL